MEFTRYRTKKLTKSYIVKHLKLKKLHRKSKHNGTKSYFILEAVWYHVFDIVTKLRSVVLGTGVETAKT